MTNTKYILIIEDENDVIELVSNRLKAAGYKTDSASNGLEGLEKIKEKEPDLIILDLSMPKMSGIEFYQRICDSENNYPKYPVLVLTARANMRDLFKEFHVNGFITKPFEGEKLVEEVRVTLNKTCDTLFDVANDIDKKLEL